MVADVNCFAFLSIMVHGDALLWCLLHQMVKCVELAFRCHLRDVPGEPTGAGLFLYGLFLFSNQD
jgi:hypothetical protein